MNPMTPDIQPNDLPWARQIMTHALELLQQRNDPETGEHCQSEDDDIYAISPYICDNLRSDSRRRARYPLLESTPYNDHDRISWQLRHWISQLISQEFCVERWLIRRVPAAAELQRSDPDLFGRQLALYRQRWLAALIQSLEQVK